MNSTNARSKAGAAAVGSITALVALSAASVVLRSPAQDSREVSDRIFSHQIVISATIGAADGMSVSSGVQPSLMARVDALRDKGPLPEDDDRLKTSGMRIENEYLGHVRNAAFSQAAAGEWSEEALRGYLLIAEMSAEDVIAGVRAAVPEAGGNIGSMSPRGSSEIVASVRSSLSDAYPGLEGAREYASLAMSQVVMVNLRGVEHLRNMACSYDVADMAHPSVLLNEISEDTGIVAGSPDMNIMRTWPEMADASRDI